MLIFNIILEVKLVTENNVLTSEGRQTFQEIIEEELIYVDKTQYLADILEGSNKTYFLARPRRFGKSLAVSTLEWIFSGNRELFQGLAIETKLDKKRFTPRPVVHLDMSVASSSVNADKFENSLLLLIKSVAKDFGIVFSDDSEPPILFFLLLKELFQKTG
jgi:hypothetical protein